MNSDSFPYKTSYSTVKQNFLVGNWHVLSAVPYCFRSKTSDYRCVSDQNAVFCCLLAEPTSLGKKKSKKEISTKWPLIRLMCAWIHLWSDQYHPEVTSYLTIPRPKWPLIIPSPERSDLWSYHPQTEVTSDHTIVRSNQIPDPVILVWEHTVCVELGLIRGHFRVSPQPGMYYIRFWTTASEEYLLWLISSYLTDQNIKGWNQKTRYLASWKTPGVR